MKFKFTNPFRKTFTTNQLQLFRFFSKVNLFQYLTHDEMDDFLPSLHLRRYQKNEAIFFRNDPSQALYIIKDGTIELNIDVKNTFETLAYPKRYISIGNNALLENTKRHYNAVVSSEEAQLYVIPQVNLMEIFQSNKEIKAKMLMALAEINDRNTRHLFKAYQNNFGFFDLGQAYMASFQSTEKK